MNRRFFVAAGLAIALGALPVLAQGPGQRMGGPGGRGRGPGGPGLFPGLQRLDLNDQQREQLRALMEDNRPQGEPGQQLRDAEMKLHAAILSDAPDARAIDSLKASINAAHAAELDHQVQMLGQVAQILTPEQRQELVKIESEGPPPGGRRGR
jgi:Spy/CpxP family protein refolding chaperone